MHHYSTDLRRWRIIAAIGIVALILTIPINSIIKNITTSIFSNSLGDVAGLTMLTMVAVLYVGFDKFLWIPIGRIFDKQVPNLNGEWSLKEDSVGILSKKSIGGDNTTKMIIDQDWSKIQIDHRCGNETYLRSDSASLTVENSANPELVITCTGEITEENGISNNIEATFRLRHIRTSGTDRLVGQFYHSGIDSSSSRVEFRRTSSRLFNRHLLSGE